MSENAGQAVRPAPTALDCQTFRKRIAMRRPAVLSLLAATTALTLAFAAPSRAAEEAVVIPAPAMDAAPASGIQTAVVAGGCFWGVQGVFQHTAGVVNAVSGYAGGTKATADYQTVSSGRTGHAESVEIKYDPKKISYGKILQIYFSVVAVSFKKKHPSHH